MIDVIESVPNFSTSDPQVVELILNEIKQSKKAFLLDKTFDTYYNRLVVSIAGTKKAVLEATLNASIKAVDLIDMRKHKGQHPRLGAVDVVPFIPVKNVTLNECVKVAREYGKNLSDKTGVPVYLYGVAQPKPEKRDLDWIREGEYERLSEMITKPGREPDYGPTKFMPKSGAAITGAREVMAGFNVNIGTSDLKIAKKIAKALHAQKGGFSNVKAMAALIPEQNIAQIGMSIHDFEKTPLYRVYEALKVECARYNVPIIGSEFCGMAPLKTLIDIAGYYLKIDNLNNSRILEIAVADAFEKGGE